MYSNACYLILNNITPSLLGFVFWNIMAKYFSPVQVGIGSALIAASNLVAVLANMGLGAGLIRFVPEAGKNTGSLINTAFTLAGSAVLIVTFIYLFGVRFWSPALSFVQDNLWFSLLFLFFTLATSLSNLIDGVLVAGRASRYVFWKNTLTTLFKFPLPVFMFTFLGGFGIFIGTGISIMTGVLIAWFLLLPKIYSQYYPYPSLQKDVIGKVLPYSFANYMANLLNTSPQFIYPLMILNILGPEYSAFFYITWMMTMVLAVIPNGISQSLFAEGSHDPNRIGRDGRRILFLALAASIPAVGVMMLVGGYLLRIFGSDYSEHGTEVMLFLAPAIIPQCVNAVFTTVNQVRKQVHLLIAQTGFLALIALGVGYWLLGRIGLPGLGIAYSLAQFVLALVVIGPLWTMLKENNKATTDNHPKVNF